MAALSNQELTEKVDALTEAVNELQVAVTNLASKKQLQQLSLLRQRELASLQSELKSVKNDITLLKNKK